MNVPDERTETDWADAGCSKRSCRYEHSNKWGLCAYAEEPPPDTRCFRWKKVTGPDGYPSIVTEEVDHAEQRAEIEREVRQQIAEEARIIANGFEDELKDPDPATLRWFADGVLAGGSGA